MIYFIQAGKDGPIKIGKSDSPLERMHQLQTAHYKPLRILWIKDTGGHDEDVEKSLHETFMVNRIRGEWFYPTPKLLNYIENQSTNFYHINLANGDKVDIIEKMKTVSIQIMNGALTLSQEVINRSNDEMV